MYTEDMRINNLINRSYSHKTINFTVLSQNIQFLTCTLKVLFIKQYQNHEITCRYQYIYVYVTHLRLRDNVKNEWSYIFALFVCFHDVDRDNFTFSRLQWDMV